MKVRSEGAHKVWTAFAPLSKTSNPRVALHFHLKRNEYVPLMCDARRSIRLEGSMLSAELSTKDGGYKYEKIDLNDRIRNENGRLVFNE